MWVRVLLGVPYGTVAQLVEPGTENPWVGGSIPPGSTIYPASSVGIEHPPSKRSVIGSSPMQGAMYGVVAQLGERLPCKQEVASSILANSTMRGSLSLKRTSLAKR